MASSYRIIPDDVSAYNLVPEDAAAYSITALEGSEYNLETDADQDIELNLDWPYVKRYQYYTGAYEVSPILYTDQVLDTDGKVMSEDVTVHRIPIVFSNNEYGGITVTIG